MLRLLDIQAMNRNPTLTRYVDRLITGLRPVLRPAIFMAHRDFDRVWSLALSGLLKHAYMVMTPPRYQSAHVASISFSTHPEE